MQIFALAAKIKHEMAKRQTLSNCRSIRQQLPLDLKLKQKLELKLKLKLKLKHSRGSSTRSNPSPNPNPNSNPKPQLPPIPNAITKAKVHASQQWNTENLFWYLKTYI